MTDPVIFRFMTELATKEGAWVIEPTNEALHRDNFLANLLSRLRNVPARISCPPGQRRDRFAERGERGRWLFVWIPGGD